MFLLYDASGTRRVFCEIKNGYADYQSSSRRIDVRFTRSKKYSLKADAACVASYRLCWFSGAAKKLFALTLSRKIHAGRHAIFAFI